MKAFLVMRILCICKCVFGWHLPQQLRRLPRFRRSIHVLNLMAQYVSPDTRCERHLVQSDAQPEMIPLTNPPLLLLQSASPIISKEECNLLSRYFETQSTTAAEIHAAETLLHQVRSTVDKVTNCPSHAGEMPVPRYVRYDATYMSLQQLMSRKFVDVLLPDGLHVDTNNGKLFRHITAILYLTDNEDECIEEHSSSHFTMGGATIFPLAVPFGSANLQSTPTNGCAAADNLLSRSIHHTKTVEQEGKDPDQRQLEQLAVDLIHRDTNDLFGVSTNDKSVIKECGIRVMPQAGKLIYFHNISDDGRPDATSFHGGEELAVISEQDLPGFGVHAHKSILVFFKEIPVEQIQDLMSFAHEVRKAREWTTNNYYM